MTIGSTGSSETSLARQLARASLAVDLGRFDAGCRRQGQDLPAGLSLLRIRGAASSVEPSGDRHRARNRERRNHHRNKQACDAGRCGVRQRDARPRPGARRHARRQHLPPWRGDLADAARPVGTNATVRRDTCLPLRSSAMRPARRSAARSLPPIWRGSIGRPASSRRWAQRWREAVPLVSPKMPRRARFRIAANTSSGLNEWPHSGGSEMYFHPGFAARNAIAAIELAEAGAFASETILEGEAGLFAAFRRQPAPAGIRLFAGPAAGNHGRLQQAGSRLQFCTNRRASSVAGRSRTRKPGRDRDRFDPRP